MGRRHSLFFIHLRYIINFCFVLFQLIDVSEKLDINSQNVRRRYKSHGLLNRGAQNKKRGKKSKFYRYVTYEHSKNCPYNNHALK